MKRVLYILTLLTLASCSNVQRIADGKPLRPRDPHHILKHSHNNSLDWEWLGFKLDADIEANGVSENFTLNVKMARDSAIWISLTPALGVEVARILLHPDSVHIISKVPNNKFVLEELLGVPFDFNLFQNLFSGTSLGLNPDEDKFVSKVDGLDYVLIEKFPRKVKKLLGGLDERALAESPSDTLSVILNHRRANRVIDRTDDEDLLIRRYWFNGITFAPTVDLFNDLVSGLSIRVERSGDEGHKEGYMPTKTYLSAFGDGVNLEVVFKIRRSRVNREYDLPFDPPADYERRKDL
jgi:hypothetical protein